jgi:tocopherol O-methyltransferase
MARLEVWLRAQERGVLTKPARLSRVFALTARRTEEISIMICGPAVARRKIRITSELATPFHRLFWGRHIHHGLWNADESPAEAQANLVEATIREAGLRGGERVLDVGCGMGASAIHLAKEWGCHVTGITISRVQQVWGSVSARVFGVGPQTRFLVANAETVQFPPGSFDLIWVIESGEYLFEKEKFVHRMADWVRPGGRVVLCAWETMDGPMSEELQRQAYEVCVKFGLPSLASGDDFRRWFGEAGLTVESCSDWTTRVSKTWALSWEMAERSRVHWLSPLVGRKRFAFWDYYLSILTAYRSGAMKYECWSVSKPAADDVVRDPPNAALDQST